MLLYAGLVGGNGGKNILVVASTPIIGGLFGMSISIKESPGLL